MQTDSVHIHGWQRTATALALGVVTLALSLGASSAGAVVAKIGGHSYGVTPINGVSPESLPSANRALGRSGSSGAASPRNFDEPPKGGGPLLYHTGPVMHSNNTHAIYWDPNGEFTETTKGIIKKFFTDVAHDGGLASNVFAVAGQYTDGTGNAAYSSTFGGALVDKTAYPASGCVIPSKADKGPPYTTCITDKQLQNELSTYIGKEGLQTGLTQLYFVLLPHKVVTCLPEEEVEPGVFVHPCSNNVFCAYHSVIGGGTPSEIIYADIPFSLLDTGDVKGCQDDGNVGLLQHPNGDIAGTDASTRFADVALKYISHEYIEATTDPQLNAWFDANELEIGDKCNGVTPDEKEDGIGYDGKAFEPTLGGTAEGENLFNQSINTDHYYLQSEWDNADKACLMKPAISAGFTPTSESTIVGSAVSFNASATDPYGKPTFAWTFGDGGIGSGSSPSHTYTEPGKYTVTMTPTDGLTGSAAPVEHTVTVAITSPPVSPSPPISRLPSELTSVNGQSSVVTTTPNSSFGILSTKVNPTTGAITFTASVSDPGAFTWALTFQNGKFGVFAASGAKCKQGFVRLSGRCRPAKIVFAKGHRAFSSPGTVSFTVKPTASGLRAVRNALGRKQGVLVTATLAFQSANGGGAASQIQTVTVKLRKKR